MRTARRRRGPEQTRLSSETYLQRELARGRERERMKIERWKVATPICLLLGVLVVIENGFVILINEHLQNGSKSHILVNFLSQQWSLQRSDSDSSPLLGKSVNGSLYEVAVVKVVHILRNTTAQQTKDRERPSVMRDSHPQDNDSRHDSHPRDNDSRHDNALPGIRFDDHRLFPPSSPPHSSTPLPARKSFDDATPPPALIKGPGFDIFKVLGRWSNLSQPFLDRKTPILRFHPSFRAQPTPISRECRLLNKHIHKNSTALNTRLQRQLVDCIDTEPSVLTPFEKNGNHIMFTARTTVSLHSQRLPVLFQTWMSAVNRSNIFIVTDGIEKVLHFRALEAGMRYIVSVPGYERLCEKAGDEINLMFQPGNQHYSWFCHTDDDMYVNLEMLVATLAKFKKDDPIYFGNSGSKLEEPRRVLPESALGSPGTPYHFAVGGFYCLNRAMLEKAREWIGDRRAFGRTCNQTKEPEDVTVGFVVGVLLGLELQRTGLIHTHGNHLHSSVASSTLKYQVAFSYGYGAIPWGNGPNVIYVPSNLFPVGEDKSQFLSLHCYYYPQIEWCLHRLHNRQQSPRHIRHNRKL